MKKLLIGIAIILLAALLVSCAKENDTDVPEVSPAGQNGENAAEQPGGIPGLTDEDVIRLYDKAREAYGWFDLTTIPFDVEKHIESDGMLFYEVVEPGINSTQDLEDHLNGIFEDGLTAELMDMASGRYAERDGKLYVMPADRGTDIFKGEETYEAERVSDDLIKLTVTVEVYDDPETKSIVSYDQFDFYLAYTDNWRFRNFELVR